MSHLGPGRRRPALPWPPSLASSVPRGVTWGNIPALSLSFSTVQAAVAQASPAHARRTRRPQEGEAPHSTASPCPHPPAARHPPPHGGTPWGTLYYILPYVWVVIFWPLTRCPVMVLHHVCFALEVRGCPGCLGVLGCVRCRCALDACQQGLWAALAQRAVGEAGVSTSRSCDPDFLLPPRFDSQAVRWPWHF